MAKRKAGNKVIINKLLLIAVLSLLGMGIIMVYSTSSIQVLKPSHNEYYFLKRQVIFACLGLVILVAASRFPYQYLVKWSYAILGVCIVGLASLLVPGVGVTVGGATRWIHAGVLSIQPSECAKLGLIIYLSYIISKKRERIRDFSTGYVPPVVFTSVLCVLVLLQPDFGGAFILMALLFIMLFVGGARLSHLVGSVIALAPLVYGLIITSPYRFRRITAFLDPWADPQDSGFHIIQSFLAFGSGGLLGQGLGNSRQKLFYIPEAHTDFILSVVGEELGLAGVLAIVLLFVLLIICGITIAYRARDPQGTFLSLGIISLLGLQASINMGVVMGLLPTKGATLPFISYGGTSLLVSLAAVGILLNISSQARA